MKLKGEDKNGVSKYVVVILPSIWAYVREPRVPTSSSSSPRPPLMLLFLLSSLLFILPLLSLTLLVLLLLLLLMLSDSRVGVDCGPHPLFASI